MCIKIIIIILKKCYFLQICIFAIYVFFPYNEKRGKNCDFGVFCDIYKNDGFSEI